VLSGKVYDRAKHVVEECARVIDSANALKNGEIVKFGEYLNQSHYSLRDLYEVTGAYLDALSARSREAEGCIGSRMTGAGFGGCTVSIVKKDKVDEFIKYVDEKPFEMVVYFKTND
jgi:galactokinase